MKPPKIWKTIKQPEGSLICIAAVTAMALGKSLKYVCRLMKPSYHEDGRPYYRTREMLKVLGSHGIHCGLIAIGDGKFSKKIRLSCNIPMIDMLAILTVPSPEITGAYHVVFWDGQVVRDPLPNVADEMPLESYNLKEIVPLVYRDETFKGV